MTCRLQTTRLHLDTSLVEENRKLLASLRDLRQRQRRQINVLGGLITSQRSSLASPKAKQPASTKEIPADLSAKLIEAQEQERARIARELHDDINQRLALLGIELEQLQDNPAEVGSRVQEPKKAEQDFERRANPFARFALLTIGISGCGCGYEKLVQGIRREAGNAD